MVEKGNCVSPFFLVRLYASYIVLFFSIFLKLDDWRMKIGTVISTPFIFAERKT